MFVENGYHIKNHAGYFVIKDGYTNEMNLLAKGKYTKRY